jgi:riboflavin kinase, archaea type
MQLKSHYWKYLLEIAKLGAMAGKVPLSTTRVGELVGASQQTASRRLAHLEELGYIKRIDVDGNKVQEILLTDKAIIELKELYSELDLIFSKPGEIHIRGKVTSGIKEGRYYVSKYSDFFKNNLAIMPFPGTLNIKLLDERDILLRGQVETKGGILMRGFTEQERSFGDVFAYRVTISKDADSETGRAIPAYFLKIERTHYDKSVIELISPFELRKELSLNDDDIVRITYLPSNQK